MEENGALPEEVSAGLRRRAIQLGLWPMNVPREMGGLGSSVLEQVVAQEEAGRATNDLWGYVGGPYNALLAGNAQQRRKYLGPAVRGDVAVAAAYAVTEPGGGSDTSNLKTRAERRSGHWVLNGEKWFVTSHGRAPVTIVHAMTGPDEAHALPRGPGHAGDARRAFTAFHDPHRGRPPRGGVRGLRGGGRPGSGEVGGADAVTQAWFREERLHIAARCLGAAQRLIEEAKVWMAEREAFGKKLHEHQAVGFMLADSATELLAARLLVYRTAWDEDSGRPTSRSSTPKRPCASSTRPRWRTVWPTAWCRSSAAAATARTTRPSATSDTCAWTASGKGRPRSCAASSSMAS